jgi:hypothetical protein
MTNTLFRAVDRAELIATLGDQCSPVDDDRFYVIGPDVNGRLCHCATCRGMYEARVTAHKLNGGRIVRDWSCACGHEWSADITHSESTSNLSGESTAWCPACGARPLIGSPQRFITSEN